MVSETLTTGVEQYSIVGKMKKLYTAYGKNQSHRTGTGPGPDLDKALHASESYDFSHHAGRKRR